MRWSSTRARRCRPTQLIFVRGVIATMLVLAVAHAMGATRRIREVARGWVAVRAIVDAIATMLYLVSLFHLPLANATAINMASPLFITVLAAFFLGERVGPSRWLAIGVGFLGVVLIIQPQAEGFDVYRARLPALDRAAFGSRSRDPAGCTPASLRFWSRCRTRSRSRCSRAGCR